MALCNAILGADGAAPLEALNANVAPQVRTPSRRCMSLLPDTPANAAPNAACARCGGAFHCGANDPTPCACTGLKLSADLLSSLRGRFSGCLCLGCLHELARTAADPRDNGHAARE